MLKKLLPFGVISGLWGALGMIHDTTTFLFKYNDSIFISYDFVYGFLVAVGIFTLIYVISEIFLFLYKRRNYFKIEPDTNIENTFEYIRKNSKFGSTVPYNQHGYNDIVSIFKNRILSGKIILFGTNDLQPIPKKINLTEINNDNLQLHYINNETFSSSISYVSLKGSDEELYRNLAISKKQLQKQFPRK